MKRTLITCMSTALLVSACYVPPNGGGYGQAAQQRQEGRDFCPERLPPAQERIEQLYTQALDTRRNEGVGATITGPNGETISVNVGTTVSAGATPTPDQVQTGLADLVFNCGGKFGQDKECFVDIYIDGEKLDSLKPTTHGSVAYRCLSAGRHNLRIEKVGETIFNDVVLLESDHEHLASIERTQMGDLRFEIYAVNELTNRIPPVPTEADRAHAANTNTGSVSVTVNDGQETVTGGATVQTSESHTYREEHHTTGSVQHDDGYDQGYEHGYEDGQAGQDGAMSASDFRDFIASIEEEGFSDGKLRIVKMAAKHNYFKAEQVAKVVEVMDFSEGKVESAVMLYPRVVDKGNFYKVLNAFDFDSNKEEVEKRLNL